MGWRTLPVIAVLLVLSNAQGNSRRSSFETRDAWARRETPSSDNLIVIDLESDRNSVDQSWPEGSGHNVDSTDDEDLVASGSGSGDGTPGHTDEDRPPIANAGADRMVILPENRVTLCGNLSTDDHGIVGYQWNKHDPMLTADMMGTGSVCTQVSNMQAGHYTFTLVVTDTAGNKASATVRVLVRTAPSSETPATKCQQMRETSVRLFGSFVPRCTEDGEYQSLQCRGHPGTGVCWCVDLGGREIPGTAKNPPDTPDCEQGKNLPPCLFKLVLDLRGSLLGSFKPRCTVDGFFQDVQCLGSVCYCVRRKSGVKMPGTEVYLPEQPICDGSAVRTTPKNMRKETSPTPKPMPPTPSPDVTTPVGVKTGVNEGDPGTTTKASGGGNQGDYNRRPGPAEHIMTQPGILAAIIGGAVVVLLCAVLLVMFVVYRMRKKDEGSYALDEPKKMPNYSYQRAPDKEFYA